MISLEVVYWIFIIFFGLIGALRGWAKEITATAGLVLSLFALDYFGPQILNIVGLVDPTLFPNEAISALYRRQFWVLTCVHLFITFWSYQGPTMGGGGRKLQRRDNVQDKLLGWIIGSLNGYFIIGTIYSFLEFRVQRVGEAFDYIRLQPNEGYAFAASTIARPNPIESLQVFNYLPLDFFSQNQLLLPLMLVALFLVILIVII
ncbi:MAG: CvpA family protein [Candidatus Promineifilaceae bacterium]